ncbi:RrF2 family transcriptional regulator [Synechococcus sp. PCC 7335]|uniref:Rrf2 family transcriptional regulator n=1 Tax=Synechococcus sp. (strain ATCC 29403 / PCC 7335) TaxID=91464 RepID=UPI00057124A1|nr:RrF2 family transcriptional regulator [Synechococcus sp. PCC 7335]
MKLTTRGHYSVKAMLDLSLQPAGSLSSVRQIAERQQLPAPYLEKLLIELRRSRLINSVRGAQGGYQLAKPSSQISLGQILEAVGESASSMTAMAVSSPDNSTQVQAEDWVTSMLWNRLNQKIQEAFHSITLEDLYYDARSWQAAQGEGASFVV